MTQEPPREEESCRWATRPCQVPGDAALVESLAKAGFAERGPGGPRPRPAGLVAELTSRPGRQVEAWLAFAGDDPTSVAVPVGLVALVTATGAAATLHSISWLLVHPAARRRGVGRTLVTEACRRARDCGAAELVVECRSDWGGAVAFWRTQGFRERPLVCSAEPS